jgi:hypothetical protein
MGRQRQCGTLPRSFNELMKNRGIEPPLKGYTDEDAVPRAIESLETCLSGRFRQETAALARLRHPNVVQVYDAGDVEGRPYFTMELVGAVVWPRSCRARRSQRVRPRRWWRRWPRPCRSPTSAGSCTATSSRPTSCSPLTAPPKSLISDWPDAWKAAQD